MKPELSKFGSPYAFRYRANNDYTLDEIKQNYVYFANRDQLNDPFDSSPSYIGLTESQEELELLQIELLKATTDPLIKDYIMGTNGIEEIQKVAQEKMEQYINSFGIACFSMYQGNYNLWANYANNYKGVCLQFDTKYDPKFFHNLLPVFYVSELKKREFKPISQENGIIDLLYHKLDQWKAEKELRLIKSDPGKQFYRPEALRNIMVGFNADYDYVQELIEAVKRNKADIGVYKMNKPKEHDKASYTLLYPHQ